MRTPRSGPGAIGLLTIAVAALLVASGCTTDSRTPSPSGTGSAASPSNVRPIEHLTPDGLAAAVTVDNVMGHVRALQKIADANGGNRAAGRPGYDASLDYVVGLLRRAGFRVSTPEFEYTRFDGGPVALTVDGASIGAQVLQYSAGTADKTLSARPVAVAGNGCAAADHPAGLRGRVAVVDRGVCPFAEKVANAQRAGAIAVIVVNNTPGPLKGGTLDVADRPTIPVVGVEDTVGSKLRAATTVTLKVTADTKDIRSRSVIAQTTTGNPDDVVMAGAHLDSVEKGPGMNDNASGTGALLETALRMGSGPRVPHAVRFAFWGAEEDGLIGSTKYVESLDAAARRAVALYLNFDMLGSPNGGYFAYDGDNSARQGAPAGPPGSDGIERTYARFYRDRGLHLQPTDFDGRSDYGPFIEVGIPAGGVLTGAEGDKTAEQVRWWGGKPNADFDPNYHSPLDTLTNINTTLLGANSAAVAYSVATYALATGGPDGVPDLAHRTRTAG